MSWKERMRRSPDVAQRMSAALLLVFTLLAIGWANSPWANSYHEFWEAHLEISLLGGSVQITLHEFVNDVLMAFFFFTVGLEVKKELTIGDLTDRSRAATPVIAAAAGLVVPALVFLAFNAGSENAHAWGVVISTDTAFLLGALAIIGPKFPARLRTFLVILAVVDDIGALLAIGLFYNEGIQLVPILAVVVLLAALIGVRFLSFARGPVYALLAVALWIAVDAAGIHPTLAGVAVALLIPVQAPQRMAVERVANLTQSFRQSPNPLYARDVVRGLRDSISLNERLQTSWAPYVAFLVLPLFALANAGVRLDGKTLLAASSSPLTWGIITGLVLGKFVGITGATWVVRRLGLGQLAPGLSLPRVAGGAALSGIGFTISLFIVDLAIVDPEAQDLARVGVLAASVIAFLAGWIAFSIVDRVKPPVAVGAVLARPVDVTRDHFRGRADAPLTIVEYGDFECPFCSRATGSIDEVRDALGDDVRWVFRHLPLTQVHPNALQAAYASEAAAMQGRFFDLAVAMFADQDALDSDALQEKAAALGLDVDRFIEDMHSAAVARRVEDDLLDAELMDLRSTPTFFIGTKRHIGPYDAATLLRALEASRAGDASHR